MASSRASFEPPEVSDIPCATRSIIEILDFVETVTGSPFEDLTIQAPDDSESAFPFRALLEFVEASCEKPLQELIIMHNGELQMYRNELLQRFEQNYSRHCGKYHQKANSTYLHRRIIELQVELSSVTSALQGREIELANMRSAQNKVMVPAYNDQRHVGSETDSDIERTRKRPRPSQPSRHLGFDGVDEHIRDIPSQGRKAISNWQPNRSNTLPDYHIFDTSFPHSPRDSQSIHFSTDRPRASDRNLTVAPSPMVVTRPSSNQGSRAASIKSTRASFEQTTVPPPLKPRLYAPALALKAGPVDDYDPLGRLNPRDGYKLMKEQRDMDVKGTWTTIDTERKARYWDKQKREERTNSTSYDGSSTSQKGSGSSNRYPHSRSETALVANSDHAKINAGWATPHGNPEMSEQRNYPVDPRFEDPELDIDPELRARFTAVTDLLKTRRGPRSAFEQRNKDALAHDHAAPVKVIIGNRVVKTLARKVDNRGELKDRHGNYIDGKNRGLMKKHLEEDRKRLIEERDKELIRATQEKRAWAAMDPSERELRLLKKARHNSLVAMLGAGMGGTDIYETEEIPEIYTRRVPAWSATQIHSVTEPDNAFLPRQEDDSPVFDSSIMLSSDNSRLDGSRSTVRPARTINNLATNTPDRATSIPAPSISEETAPSVLETIPELAPLQDITVDLTEYSDDAAALKFDTTREACSKRGRVVLVSLHEPVLYSTSAVVERIFGGAIQEIQFFPEDRQALVAFVHPDEAATFIKHVQSVKERDRTGYRQLQVDAEWHRGVEPEAVYPAQKNVLAAVIAGKASRSIVLRGLSPELDLNELARQSKLRLSKIIVKVILVKQRNSFTRQREGNTGILEFASIRDAVEVMAAFTSKKVADFTRCTAEVLPDSCCKGPPNTKDYCRCIYCFRA